MRGGLIGVAICLLASAASAQERPMDGTVFIRVIGDVTAVFPDEFGTPRRPVEVPNVNLGTGSGLIVSRFGYVVTNHHVIAGGQFSGRVDGIPAKLTLTVQRIEVWLTAPRSDASAVARYDAAILATDPHLDVAVLTIPGTDFPYIPFGDSDALKSGQPVSVVGYPLGDALDLGRKPGEDPVAPTLATGIVSALREDAQGVVRYIQTSAPLNRGNSGGPLLDRAGFAAGIVQLKLASAEGIGFAIPINLVKDFLARNGVDTFLPATRLTLGPVYDAPGKLVRFQPPHGFQDAGASRLGVDSGASLPGVSLHIDRVAAAWMLEQLDEELRSGRAFERYASTRTEQPVRDESVLRGQAHGRADGRPFRMVYMLLDLGEEKIVARYIGTAEQIAFNESVLTASLTTLRAGAMLAPVRPEAREVRWMSVPGRREFVSVIPAGWLLDAGGPEPCSGLAAPRESVVASPRQDFTVAFRAAARDGGVDPAEAVVRCARRNGSSPGEYRYTFSRFGIAYTVEGMFQPVGSRLLQFEAIAPTRRSTGLRDVFTQWLTELAGAAK